MKTLKEQLNESMQINESFLSFGLSVIVALKLAALALGELQDWLQYGLLLQTQ